ncbi:hypothetical protein ACHAWF_003538, partial [Thalassiosira exigua]
GDIASRLRYSGPHPASCPPLHSKERQKQATTTGPGPVASVWKFQIVHLKFTNPPSYLSLFSFQQIGKMEEVLLADERIKAARDSVERDYEVVIADLNQKQRSLAERLRKIEEKKHRTAQEHGNVESSDDDLVEINAGGKIVAAKRSTLTQQTGTRMEALFSGRWDKKLQRDSDGRIFLDVNPKCFRAIVDHLNEMAISSEEDPPSPPSVGDEDKRILRSQLELFGL